MTEFLNRQLGDVVKKCRLNRRQRGRLARRTGQNDRSARLDHTLNQSDRKLRPQGHDGAAPSLTAGRVAKAERLEVLSRRIQEPLCSLTVNVKITPAESDQRCDAAIEGPNARHALGMDGHVGTQCHAQRQSEPDENGAPLPPASCPRDRVAGPIYHDSPHGPHYIM